MSTTRWLVRCATAAFLFLPLTSAVAAGDEGGSTDTSESPSVRRWMLQFRIGRDFAFSGFQDAGLSVQRNLGDRSALRLGVGVAVNSGTSRRLDQTGSGYRLDDGSTHGHSYGVDLQWIRYRHVGAETRAYWGAGPSAGYGRSRVADNVTYTPGSAASVSVSQTTWIAGAGAVGGVEWWPVGEVGLIFEYGVNVRYREVEQKFRAGTPPTSESRAVSKSWEMEFASVRLGVGLRL